jgi:DUF4097 and DUF4098 domain-containing protein YvlB
VVLVLTASLLSAEAAFADDDWCHEEGRWGGRQERYCEVREQTFSGGAQLHVDARPNGGIEVTGWDKNEVRVEAKVVAHAETEADARRLAGEVRVDMGGTIQAEGPASGDRRSWWVSYRLHVPRNQDLSLVSTNGGIHVQATRGELDLTTSNGALHLEDVGGRVRGRTTNGGVQLSLTGSEWAGEGVELRTSNGGVKVVVPDGYNAHLEIGTVNGGVHADFPITMRGRLDRDLNMDLGRGGAPIKIFTTNGGVSLQRR